MSTDLVALRGTLTSFVFNYTIAIILINKRLKEKRLSAVLDKVNVTRTVRDQCQVRPQNRVRYIYVQGSNLFYTEKTSRRLRKRVNAQFLIAIEGGSVRCTWAVKFSKRKKESGSRYLLSRVTVSILNCFSSGGRYSVSDMTTRAVRKTTAALCTSMPAIWSAASPLPHCHCTEGEERCAQVTVRSWWPPPEPTILSTPRAGCSTAPSGPPCHRQPLFRKAAFIFCQRAGIPGVT